VTPEMPGGNCDAVFRADGHGALGALEAGPWDDVLQLAGESAGSPRWGSPWLGGSRGERHRPRLTVALAGADRSSARCTRSQCQRSRVSG